MDRKCASVTGDGDARRAEAVLEQDGARFAGERRFQGLVRGSAHHRVEERGFKLRL